MSDIRPVILWFRYDLRLEDHPALVAAVGEGQVIPIYIHDTSAANRHAEGGAARWWLAEALKDLRRSLAVRGANLVLRQGDPMAILPQLAADTGAVAVHASRCYDPALRRRDGDLKGTLERQGVACKSHPGFLLFEPEAVRTGSGMPFRVFTPFSRACFAAPSPLQPMVAPKKIQGVGDIPSDTIDDWKLVPRAAIWPQGLAAAWQPTEGAAQERLRDFIDAALSGYRHERDRMDRSGTSRLSPYLHFGQISPRQVWHEAQVALAMRPELGAHAERFLLEILWREFSWHLIWNFPPMLDQPLMPSFARFPWRHDVTALRAWQQGRTGYPIVDAGMRQLWQTGWMHNRARMIVASFLVKHLLIDWREGMAWFWDTLVDADPGSNTASWQWVAGCGADAAPYFRIFNPILQGKKFDPDGAYVRRYVPELARLDTAYIHEPWNAPPLMLAGAGVTLGQTYPLPVVEHNAARRRALEALARVKVDKA